MTLYPPWSLDTNDRCDFNLIANDRCIKEIQDKLNKDTPVKTEINKPYKTILPLITETEL